MDSGVQQHVELYTDHLLVDMVFKLKSPVPSRVWRRGTASKINFHSLLRGEHYRISAGQAFDDMILSRLRISPTVEFGECIQFLQKAVSKLPKKAKGKKQKEDWFDSDDVVLCDLIKKRREAWLLYLKCGSLTIKKCHRRLSKLVLRRERNMRDVFWVNLAREIQAFDDKNDAKSFFAAAKLVFGGRKKKVQRGDGSGGIGMYQKDKVTLAVTESEINALWLEHCKLLFNQPSVVSDAINEFMGAQRPVHVALATDFLMKELLLAIAAMKFDKAPGNDGLPIEVFCLLESKELLPRMLGFFNRALRSGVVHSGLKDVIITTLFKKGNPMFCDNYRTLSLINHIGKVLEKMIQFRLEKYCEDLKILPESQNGFRRDRSTIDAMFVSRLLSSAAREKFTNIYKLFVDLTKAYDKVNRDILWKVLQRIGVPIELINLIQGLLVDSKAAIRIKGEIVGNFSLDMGLKQGSVFSPLLFNIFFGAIIDAWQLRLKDKGIPMYIKFRGDILSSRDLMNMGNSQSFTIMEMLFADDAEIVASSAEELQEMLDVFVTVTEAFGQEVSIPKTKVMVVDRRACRADPSPSNPTFVFNVHGSPLGSVDVFTYVGGCENRRGSMDDEVTIRLSKMSAAFASLQDRVFSNKNLRLSTKLRVFDVIVMANGLYGCATWNLKASHLESLESWKFRHLKKILRCKWEDLFSMVDVYKRIRSYGIKIDTVEVTIRRRRLMYFGHVLRMDDSRLPKIVLQAHTSLGVSRVGALETNYRSCIKEDFKAFGIPSVDPEFLVVQDRVEWKKLVKKGAEHCYNNWVDKRQCASFCRYLDNVFSSLQPEDEDPSDEDLSDGWKVHKLGPFWKIEEEEDQITVRRGSSTYLLAKKAKKFRSKRSSVVELTPSLVSRKLQEIKDLEKAVQPLIG